MEGNWSAQWKPTWTQGETKSKLSLEFESETLMVLCCSADHDAGKSLYALWLSSIIPDKYLQLDRQTIF